MNSHENKKDLLEAARNATKYGESLIERTEPVTLLYWEDEFGKHSYYKNDIMIK